MAEMALFSLGFIATSFVSLFFMIIIGGNLIFNGVVSALIACMVFAVSYCVCRYFTREIWDNGCLSDEIHISFFSYFMMLVVGSAGVWFFGPDVIPETMHNMLSSFSCVASFFTGTFCGYILEVADDPNE